ncbi:MAG: tyrosine-type recombinase/integrase, partial [Candidatus Desulforudis sp.]|nr:tyrosine-type recombinase/integrase [Desulforudis sp.]
FCAERNLDPFRLTGPQARDFRNLLVGRGLGPSTVNASLSHLKKFYAYLVDEGFLTGNPVIRRRLRVREPDRLPRFLPPDEKQKILAWFRDHAPRDVALAFRTMFASGLRLGECAALRPEDLLVRGNAYLLHVRLGKGAKGRLAPVVDRNTALDLLHLAQERSPGKTLFGLSATVLAGHARACAAATGIDFHAHRCRHTFATELLRRGVPLDVVQEALGHADINTTRTYARTAPQALMELGRHRRDG